MFERKYCKKYYHIYSMIFTYAFICTFYIFFMPKIWKLNFLKIHKIFAPGFVQFVPLYEYLRALQKNSTFFSNSEIQ
jgi:hypothetical protein